MKIFVPKNRVFYELFEKVAGNSLLMANKLKELVAEADFDRRASILTQIEDMEHTNDELTHNIFTELGRNFITPFDREDIHLLASALDDVMDCIDGSATRFVLYKLQECPKDLVTLMGILHDSVIALREGVTLLRDFRKAEQLQQILEKVNQYENNADAVFQQAIADLFENEKNPIQIIKLKEVYVALETATDKCEDAANVMESLLIKHG